MRWFTVVEKQPWTCKNIFPEKRTDNDEPDDATSWRCYVLCLVLSSREHAHNRKSACRFSMRPSHSLPLPLSSRAYTVQMSCMLVLQASLCCLAVFAPFSTRVYMTQISCTLMLQTYLRCFAILPYFFSASFLLPKLWWCFSGPARSSGLSILWIRRKQ